MEIEKKTKDFKSLSRVVKTADLEEIFLTSSNVWRDIDALNCENINAKIGFGGELLNLGDGHFTAKVNFSIKGTCKDEEEGEEREIIKIEVEYVLAYSLTGEALPKKDDLGPFCEINAVYNAWPYCREYIQTTTNRMGVPALTLPLLKFRPPKRKKAIEKEKKGK